jgi:hypothetical protein
VVVSKADSYSPLSLVRMLLLLLLPPRCVELRGEVVMLVLRAHYTILGTCKTFWGLIRMAMRLVLIVFRTRFLFWYVVLEMSFSKLYNESTRNYHQQTMVSLSPKQPYHLEMMVQFPFLKRIQQGVAWLVLKVREWTVAGSNAFSSGVC